MFEIMSMSSKAKNVDRYGEIGIATTAVSPLTFVTFPVYSYTAGCLSQLNPDSSQSHLNAE